MRYCNGPIRRIIDCEASGFHHQRTLLAAIVLLMVARLDEKKTIENKNNGTLDCKRAITSNARTSSRNQSPRIKILMKISYTSSLGLHLGQ